MKQVAAAENLTITMETSRWRLMTNPNGDPNGERLILEANSGEPLRYQPPFAATRRLPRTGELPVDYIREVVVGWSHTDEAWHLGLLLGPSLAEARGSRWCEIAYWPDPDRTVFYELAHEAGQTLAQTLGRPFGLIQPRPLPVEDARSLPLPPLPARCGEWLLDYDERLAEGSLVFTRARRWATARITRIGWYAFWIVVYFLLSISTLRTDLALPNAGTMLPNPEMLPYLGLAAAFVLLVMIGFSLYELFTQPNRLVVDSQQRSISATRGKRIRWQWWAQDIQSVYVTQVVNRRGKKRIVYHAELNLHLGGGDFRQILQQAEQDEASLVASDGQPAEDGVQLLQPGGTLSEIQAVGVHLAAALGGLPCWYDQRVR